LVGIFLFFFLAGACSYVKEVRRLNAALRAHRSARNGGGSRWLLRQGQRLNHRHRQNGWAGRMGHKPLLPNFVFQRRHPLEQLV
jgi:hypothetical protein